MKIDVFSLACMTVIFFCFSAIFANTGHFLLAKISAGVFIYFVIHLTVIIIKESEGNIK